MSPAPIVARILSCRGREDSLATTLCQFSLSDWGRAPLIQRRESAGTRMDRINANWLAGLSAAGHDTAVSLIVEDDIEINRHLRHNLECWAPLEDPALFASLYNGAGLLGGVVDASRMWGGQAVLVSPPMAAHIVAHWNEETGFADTRMPRLASRLGPVYQHAPSLVQHVGRVSTWGGPFHQAADFDPNWRAA